MKKPALLLGVCAGIAAYKACELINILRKESIDVTVCMTDDASHFITPLTLQVLSGNKVYSSMFEPQKDMDPLHISLAEKADLVLVYPATADVISKVACGICDQLLMCIIASTKSPVVFAPAMNDVMYNNKILQANIDKLRKLGYSFVGPVKGRLACGREAIGHIADIRDLVQKIKPLLQ